MSPTGNIHLVKPDPVPWDEEEWQWYSAFQRLFAF
jgi:hypothetical protein